MNSKAVAGQKLASLQSRTASSGLLQRRCACGSRTHGSLGECDGCSRKRIPALQTKMRVSVPGDAFELEADQVAGRVMTMSSPKNDQDANAQPAASGVQRRVSNGSSGLSEAPDIVNEVLRSPGQPLDSATRAFFEPRFGHDFSRVRVHADAKATASARAVDALAYTVGEHIAFESAQFNPNSHSGRKLLAHELTHVLQQQSSYAAGGAFTSTHAQQLQPKTIAVTRACEPMLQAGKSKECKGWQCAGSDQCAAPDPGRAGNGEPSTDWVLDINIDIEEDSWRDALIDQAFGHTYVRFVENSGREYSYGFYPRKELPNESRRSVPGCVSHPDNTHDACIDDRVTYTLKKPQYDAALEKAHELCRNPKDYGQKYTCNSFANEIASAAGQSLPSSASEPTTVYYQDVPSIDNPNTLIENVQEAREKGSLKKPKAGHIERARQLIGFIKIPSTSSHGSVFKELNSLSMDDMLKLLTEIDRQKMLQSLFDFFDAARGVNRERLRAAMTAAKLKSSSSGAPSPAAIEGVLGIAPDLPGDQKEAIRRYLGK